MIPVAEETTNLQQIPQAHRCLSRVSVWAACLSRVHCKPILRHVLRTGLACRERIWASIPHCWDAAGIPGTGNSDCCIIWEQVQAGLASLVQAESAGLRRAVTSQMWLHWNFLIKTLFIQSFHCCFVADQVHPEHSPSRHATCLHSLAEWLGHVVLSHYLRAFDLSSQLQFQDELMFIPVRKNLKPCFHQGKIHFSWSRRSMWFHLSNLGVLKTDVTYLTFVKINIMWPNFPMSLSVPVWALEKEGLHCSAN